MAQSSKIKEFPDITTKLTAPTKKSLFERQKAEAEAKRQREQQETAAVYEDFIKSFDDADDSTSVGNRNFQGGAGSESLGAGRTFGGPSKRHFSGPPTGPASRGGFGGGRGSGPGSLGPPPPSLSRKRAHDGSHPLQKDPNASLFAFEDSITGDPKSAFLALDDEDKSGRARLQERATPKPTIKMSSLPPGTSPAVIKSLLPLTLQVDAVKIIPPAGPGNTERRSHSAIVTLAKDTPAVDIDAVVSALQNRYLGRGFYLSLSRYLSSVAVGAERSTSGIPSSSSLPFGAKPIPTGPGSNFRAPPGSHRGGFAPPQSYAPSGPIHIGRGGPQMQITVKPPSDLKQLKLIHKTLEALLTHGPEFEALLMSRREIQMEERWAWLWDSRSTGGVYYRWRLWDILTGAQNNNAMGRHGSDSSTHLLFEGGATWVPPEKNLPFEYTTRIEQFVSDSEYDSSEDEDSGDEGRRRHLHHHGGAPPPEIGNMEGDDQAYLNPLQKAKLTHLLARLPTTNAKLRRGDVARVTAFAIQHAGEGADEVVQMITSNVQTPFSFSGANPDHKTQVEDTGKDDEEPPDDEKKANEKEDTSSSMLIGLFVISDILSSSSTSGVRHAWRYRQLFEAALRQHHVFESLGRLEKVMHWGRMRANKWKRSVLSVLTLWEGWCVFPEASQQHFTSVFTNPPLTVEEEAAVVASEKASVAALAAKSKWKTVEEKAQAETWTPESAHPSHPDMRDEMDVDIDVDGEPMADDEYLDGEPMDDENIDGEPMADDDEEHLPKADSLVGEDLAHGIPSPAGVERAVDTSPSRDARSDKAKEPPVNGRRRRPKAEDMFADSDGE